MGDNPEFILFANLLDGLKKIKQFTVDLTSVETNMVSLLDHLLSLIVPYNISPLDTIIIYISDGVFARYSLILRIHA
jgi:hypothetical protein